MNNINSNMTKVFNEKRPHQPGYAPGRLDIVTPINNLHIFLESQNNLSKILGIR
jgi:hypothetical protein